ncbi:MAG: hypothetical protein KDK25_16035 [Leptospiraceae bacterium]|nr:hypothetical protein [Leptospiraceae bacterium]
MEEKRQPGERTIRLITSVRLPDVHHVPEGYDRYGRFAILQSGNFWFGDERSSHPHCRIGFYYATIGRQLFLSPRGVAHGFEEELTGDLLEFLLGKLGWRGGRLVRGEVNR